MRYVLVSACLMGVNCKYNGENNESCSCLELLNREEICLIPVCPEQLGGMGTPRVPSERSGVHVVNQRGEDVTPNFQKGAEETLKIAKKWGCKEAVLKEKSPSCGSSWIYDGSFSGNVIPGKGYTAEILEKNGIHIMNETSINL